MEFRVKKVLILKYETAVTAMNLYERMRFLADQKVNCQKPTVKLLVCLRKVLNVSG